VRVAADAGPEAVRTIAMRAVRAAIMDMLR